MSSAATDRISQGEVDLDHVAIASEHAIDNFDRYSGDLGGRYVMGQPDRGFWWGQLRFANGMKLELLEPANVAVNDFLRRFLDRNGPGPHHVTFKVKNIEAALAAARGAGYEPLGVNLANALWKEAFLHPKQSHGIVVQLAQGPAEQDIAGGILPPARCAAPAKLERIVHLVADFEAAAGLFRDVLAGEVLEEGKTELGRHLDLRWPGPGRVRLVEPAAGPPATWLGERPGRLHHLEFVCDAPGRVPGARPLGSEDGVYEVSPEQNLGVGLRLRAPA